MPITWARRNVNSSLICRLTNRDDKVGLAHHSGVCLAAGICRSPPPFVPAGPDVNMRSTNSFQSGSLEIVPEDHSPYVRMWETCSWPAGSIYEQGNGQRQHLSAGRNCLCCCRRHRTHCSTSSIRHLLPSLPVTQPQTFLDTCRAAVQFNQSQNRPSH